MAGAAAVACVAVICAILLFPQPTYQGKTLNSWLREIPVAFPPPGQPAQMVVNTSPQTVLPKAPPVARAVYIAPAVGDPRVQPEIAQAIRAIGTNGFTHYKRVLTRRDYALFGYVDRILDAQSPLTFRFRNRQRERQQTIIALALLGAEAIPLLEELLHDSKLVASTKAVLVTQLSRLGPQATEVLERALATPGFPNPQRVAEALIRIDTENTSAWLTLLKHGSDSRRTAAVLTLASVEADRDRIIPELIAVVDDPSPQVRDRAVAALARFKATNAVPRLQELLQTESRPAVRNNIRRALTILDTAAANTQTEDR